MDTWKKYFQFHVTLLRSMARHATARCTELLFVISGALKNGDSFHCTEDLKKLKLNLIQIHTEKVSCIQTRVMHDMK